MATEHTDEWVVVLDGNEKSNYPRVLEKNADGTFTEWQYAMFGAIGHTGALKPEVKYKPVTNARERKEVERIRKMVARGVERSQLAYDMMKG